MARDAELLDLAKEGRGFCRLYYWSEPWVSLGRFQRLEDVAVPGFTKYVVRPTGGKAVLHGHDVTVAIATPFSGRSVRDAYETALGPVLQALNACGCAASLANDLGRRDDSGPNCFASTSPYDIVSGGVKVAGAAMRISKGVLLLQVSVPCGPPLVEPGDAIKRAKLESIQEWLWERFSLELRNLARRSSVVQVPESRPKPVVDLEWDVARPVGVLKHREPRSDRL